MQFIQRSFIPFLFIPTPSNQSSVKFSVSPGGH